MLMATRISGSDNNDSLPSISSPGNHLSRNIESNHEMSTKNDKVKRKRFHGFRTLLNGDRHQHPKFTITDESKSTSISLEHLPSVSSQPLPSLSPQHSPSLSSQNLSSSSVKHLPPLSPQSSSLVSSSSSSPLFISSSQSSSRVNRLSVGRSFICMEKNLCSMPTTRCVSCESLLTREGSFDLQERNETGERDVSAFENVRRNSGDFDSKSQEHCNLRNHDMSLKDKKTDLFQNPEELRRAFKQAKAVKNYSTVVNYMQHVFSSLYTLAKTFKVSDNNLGCGYNVQFVDVVFHLLMKLPSDNRKTILKSVVVCLLNNIKVKQEKAHLLGYLILLQNPQFDNPSSHLIFSTLLKQMNSLSDRQHETLVHWMCRLPVANFKDIVNRLKEFVCLSHFKKHVGDSSSLKETRSWVISAVKILSLCNASNWVNETPIVSYQYMYMVELNNLKLEDEYKKWQNRSGFSFCQFPFLLTLNAKRFLLQKDSEIQMIEIARRSLLQGVRKRKLPAVNMLFLHLKIRRNNLMLDSLNEISRNRGNLKKKLKVTFVGEPGIDMGGLTKEWFMLLVRKIFRPKYGMFQFNEKSSCYWFTNIAVDNLAEFNLVGVLMGLAVYNSTILDIRFPLCCYKKLLSPPVVPYDPNTTVGITKLTLRDLKEVNPELGKGLQELLNYEGNVEEDICQTFQVSFSRFGSVVTEDLVENGHLIPVTNDNRRDYVDLYVDHILNKSIQAQFNALYYGFHSVCASNALIMLRPEEVEMLVCGNPVINMKELRKVTIYDAYSKHDQIIRYFWDIVENFSDSLKRKLLRFCTGSDRIPVGGMLEMDFKITRTVKVSEEMLPMAHTCFNQLCLPKYKTKQQLKKKLTIAISNSEGFGIE